MNKYNLIDLQSILKTHFLIAAFVAMSGIANDVKSQEIDIRGCWRQESHVYTLTDGSSRQETARCVNYYSDAEFSVACNWLSDPDYRGSGVYQVKKQGNVSIISIGKDPYAIESEFGVRSGKLIITSHYQRPTKISPNEFASGKISVFTRLQIADRETCLSQAKFIPQETKKAIELAVGVIDSPRPLFKTKIDVATFGSIRWLDTGHLAITAADTNKTYGQGKIVSVDISNKFVTTLLESGFVWRTNPEASLVAVTKGKVMQGNESSSTDVFYRWDSKRKALVDEERPPKPSQSGRYWNWHTCTETTKEDSNRTFFKELTGKAYLRPDDGSLNWDSSPPPPQGFPVSLISSKGIRKPLDLYSGEVIGQPIYYPFLKGYVLSGGRFSTGGVHYQYAGKKFDQYPLVTLNSQNVVVRSFIPKQLKTFLDKRQSSGQIFPAPEGLLIYVGGWASEGGGIYLSQGDISTRIWCSPSKFADENCNVISLEISPNGCNVAIVPQDSKSPVILPICENE